MFFISGLDIRSDLGEISTLSYYSKREDINIALIIRERKILISFLSGHIVPIFHAEHAACHSPDTDCL